MQGDCGCGGTPAPAVVASGGEGDSGGGGGGGAGGKGGVNGGEAKAQLEPYVRSKA